VFLYVGRLVAGKNVRTLLRAARMVADAGEQLEVWIVGDGPDLRSLAAEANRLQGGGLSYRFLGRVDYRSIGFVLERADVFVMPTLYDYRCVAVLEAMQFGLPLIVSKDDGNAGATVHDGREALIFDPTSAADLAECMRLLCRDAPLRSRLGGAAREAARHASTARAIPALRHCLAQAG
jgi:glycosyltransferase involved in cell wall biosynthesis